MGRLPCCDEPGLKKGPWTPEEDKKLVDYIGKHGHGSWRNLPKLAGLNRCGKSCRLRWTNYLRPDIRRGKFTEEEERIIINLHSVLGNKWSRIAQHLPGRTDNEIKNFWNTHLRKKLLQMGIDPTTHKPRTDLNHLMNLSQLLGLSSVNNSMNLWGNSLAVQADMTHVAKLQLLQNLLQTINTTSFLNMGNPSLGLLGKQNLNPFQGLVNDTNTELLRAYQQYPNYVLPGQQYSSETETKLLRTGTESRTHVEFLGVNNCSSASQGGVAEHLLPSLVTASSASCSTSNLEESSGNQIQPFSQVPSSSVFEAWEKLMDNDTSDSRWTEILDFASTSASPVSW